jgi:hypothetical protein
MWWRFVHEPAVDGSPGDNAGADPGGQDAAGAPSSTTVAESPEEIRQDAEMAAYNDYLAQLAERDKATGR